MGNYRRSNTTILITSIGSVAAEISIEILRKQEFRVIGTDIYPHSWVANALMVNEFYQVPKTIEYEDYFASIREICSRERIEFIIPLTDVDIDFYDKNRDYFDQEGIVLCIPDHSSLSIIRHKKLMQEFVREHCTDINYVPTRFVSERFDDTWGFPIVCKPYNGRSSQGLRFIHSEKEWEILVNSVDVNRYIAEPYVDGYIVIVDMICQPEYDAFYAISRKELLSTPHGIGTAVEIIKNETIERESCEIAKALSIRGCVNFEFIVDNYRNYHFIECNPRFSAGVKFSYLAGYDFVSNHLNCFRNVRVSKPECINRMVITRKYEEYVMKTMTD